jgi:hypothetical protein
VHREHDAGESEEQTRELAKRERLAQQPGRKQSEDQRVRARDDRPHPGGEMA